MKATVITIALVILSGGEAGARDLTVIMKLSAVEKYNQAARSEVDPIRCTITPHSRKVRHPAIAG